MHEITVKIWDDLDFARDGTRTEAFASLTIGLNGKWVQLDLAEPNHTLVLGTLEKWMAAGHQPETDPVARPRGMPGRAAGYKIPKEALQRGKDMRAFAEAHKIPYVTKTGKYYYSTRLVTEFDKHRAKEGKDHG